MLEFCHKSLVYILNRRKYHWQDTFCRVAVKDSFPFSFVARKDFVWVVCISRRQRSYSKRSHVTYTKIHHGYIHTYIGLDSENYTPTKSREALLWKQQSIDYRSEGQQIIRPSNEQYMWFTAPYSLACADYRLTWPYTVGPNMKSLCQKISFIF